MVIVAGVIGTVTALWLYNNFTSWLSFLNATLPPVGGIIILDFFMNRDRYKEGKVYLDDVNWGAIAGVVAGALVGNFVKFGISSINAMVTACVIYAVYTKLIKKD